MFKKERIGLVVCALAACASVSSTQCRAADTYMQGFVEYFDFTLAAGDRVIATGNLTISCSNKATIEGIIEADPGISVTIAASEIHMKGTINGADGLSTRAINGNGQHAGNITLNAPFIKLQSTKIHAGAGGNAGASGDGGNGGSISLVACDVLVTIGKVVLEAGTGGRGGDGVNGYTAQEREPGAGGEGGSVFADCNGENEEIGVDPPAPCTAAAGSNGATGLNATGGQGGAGGNGSNGTQWTAPTAGHQGNKGGSGFALRGKNGGVGSSCCPPNGTGPGGAGGVGGGGGTGTGGKGGTGGRGGDAWYNELTLSHNGPGADGGKGGTGGIGRGGGGGRGGKGGDGSSPGAGGAGGGAGTGVAGARGDGGPGGDGTSDGSPGPLGDPGTVANPPVNLGPGAAGDTCG